MRYLTMFPSILLLASCAMQPKLGTSLSSWQSECKQKTLIGGQLVAAAENMKAYTCNTGGNTAGIVYIFQDDELVQITTNTELAALANQRAQTAGQIGTNMLILQQLSR